MKYLSLNINKFYSVAGRK